MSFDPEDVMKRVECPVCEKYVEDYEPGVSSVTVDQILYHPRCAPEPEGHVTAVSAEYAKEVHDYLTTGKNATRPENAHPLLNEEETEELIENFLLGIPAKVFAGKLECRDIYAFDEASETRYEADCCRDFGAEFRDGQIEAQGLKR